MKGRPMKLYISTSDETIGSMLAEEDESGNKRAIFYLSQILNDAETRYSAFEKLFLCLYFSCLKPVDVMVFSLFDILKHMLSKPILHSRIGKWALAITEYSLFYIPLKAIKGQAIAYFLVEHTMPKEIITFVELQPWKLYFDGS